MAVALTSVATAAEADFAVDNGWFFSQTGPGDGTGFSVTDADDAPFFTNFQALGGVDTFGYPVSRRFVYKGFTNQAFQKAILQWQPDSNSINFLNVYDELSALGKDDELEATKLTPPSRDWSGDVGLPWDDVVNRHLAVLNENTAILSAFLADSAWMDHYGLPMAYEDLGDVRVMRAQRAVFQQWMIEVPWASAGQVVIANGGDIAKELGLVPGAAGLPHSSDTTPPLVTEAQEEPSTATPTLVYSRDTISCAHAGDRLVENVPIADLEDFIIQFVVASGNGIPGIDFRGTSSSWGYVLLVGTFIADGELKDLRLLKLFGTTQTINVYSGVVPLTEPYLVTIQVQGSVIGVWVNGNWAGGFTNISGIGTDLGLACMNFSSSPSVNVVFQDINVWIP